MLHLQHMFPSLATKETSQETMFQQQCFLAQGFIYVYHLSIFLK